VLHRESPLDGFLYYNIEIYSCPHYLAHHPHSSNVEWAAWIIRDSATGRYGFYGTVFGRHDNVRLGPVRYDIAVATIHTHPTAGTNRGHLEYFSYRDAAGIYASIIRDIMDTPLPGFLVTPLEHVYRMHPGFPLLDERYARNTVHRGHDNWHMVGGRFIDNIFNR